nr:hypothetical protein K-LCC10_0403 [Kaumoebavirus]
MSNSYAMYFEYLRAGELEIINMDRFAERLLPHLKLDIVEKPETETVSDNIALAPPQIGELVLTDAVEGVEIERVDDKYIVNVHTLMTADNISLNFEIADSPRLLYFTVAAQCKTSATNKVNPASGYVEAKDSNVRINLFGKKNNNIDALIVLYFAH